MTPYRSIADTLVMDRQDEGSEDPGDGMILVDIGGSLP